MSGNEHTNCVFVFTNSYIVEYLPCFVPMKILWLSVKIDYLHIRIVIIISPGKLDA